MKTWIFRQAEIRKPKNNTEVVDFEGFPTMVSELLYPHKEYPILTLEVFESDPMEGIRVVVEEANRILEEARPLNSDLFTPWTCSLLRFAAAIKKAVEGK